MIEQAKTFWEVLDLIESTGSTDTKRQYIIEAIQKFPEAEAFFRLACNDIVYGFSEKSFYNAFAMHNVVVVPGTTFPHVSDWLNELVYLGSNPKDPSVSDLIGFALTIKECSGNDQLERLYQFFMPIPDYKKKWYSRALLQELRIGANTKTINSALKFLGKKIIKKFKMQLAEKIDIFDEEQVAKYIKFPCTMECKYDGIRIQAEVYENEVTLTSRRGNDRTADFPEIVAALIEKFPDQHVILDGEIIKNIGTDVHSFQQMMRKDENRNYQYIVFDLLMQESLAYKDRWSNLEMLFGEWAITDVIRLADHFDCNNIKDLQEYFEHLLSINKEGIMIKDDDAPYERGTRRNMFKCKKDYVKHLQSEQEADLKIIGWKYGSGKNHNVVSTLELTDGANNIRADVGSGITDDMKIYLTEQKDALIGKICEIRYNEKTETGSLRFTRFIQLRDDKDEADIL